MSTKPNIPEEEVDLGTLFSQIGKMFSNFFDFIGNIFKSLYHYLILFLLFVKKNVLVLGLATLIGAIAGFIVDFDKEPVYRAEMEVETAYGSANQFYKQIAVVNSLIANEDSVKIAQLFDIPSDQTRWISGFSIEPIEPLKQKLLAYDLYMQETDTIYTRGFEYADFEKRLDEKDLRFYKVTGNGSKPGDFRIFTKGFKKLVETEFYINLKDKTLGHLSFIHEEVKDNIYQLDSLRQQYKEVAILQAKKQNTDAASLNLSTSNTAPRNLDMDINNYSLRLMQELEIINEKIVRSDSILNITSDFGPTSEYDSLIEKNWIKYGVLGFVLALLFISGLHFNRYLNNYEKRLVK